VPRATCGTDRSHGRIVRRSIWAASTGGIGFPQNVKRDTIGRSAIRGQDDLKAVAVGALGHLQKVPVKVRLFFAGPKLAYVLQ
jgi:hypothetical protein